MGSALDVTHPWPQTAISGAFGRGTSPEAVAAGEAFQSREQPRRRSQVNTGHTAESVKTSPGLTHAPSGDALESWVLRARSGDKAAFGQIVTLLQEPLYRAVFRLVRHSQDARDITQRALLRAWLRLPDLKSPGAFRSWLFSIGLNLARNHLRDRGGKYFEEIDDAAMAVQPVAYKELSAHEQRLKLRGALAHLPERQREVVTLRIDAEMSFKEIGEAVGCSEGSARVNFHHGMKRLQAMVGSEEG